MSITTDWDEVLEALEHNRALILGKAADEITYTIPMLAVPRTAADAFAHHQRQMYESVERLHDSLQALRLHERLLLDEFKWAAEALPRWGVTAEHLEELIDCYLRTAQVVASWKPEELRVLEAIRDYLRDIARTTFPVA